MNSELFPELLANVIVTHQAAVTVPLGNLCRTTRTWLSGLRTPTPWRLLSQASELTRREWGDPLQTQHPVGDPGCGPSVCCHCPCGAASRAATEGRGSGCMDKADRTAREPGPRSVRLAGPSRVPRASARLSPKLLAGLVNNPPPTLG